MLCGITSDPKVKSMERREEFSPYPKLVHELNERVPHEEDVGLFVFAVGYETVVQRQPPPVSLDVVTRAGSGGRVGLSSSGAHHLEVRGSFRGSKASCGVWID